MDLTGAMEALSAAVEAGGWVALFSVGVVVLVLAASAWARRPKREKPAPVRPSAPVTPAEAARAERAVNLKRPRLPAPEPVAAPIVTAPPKDTPAASGASTPVDEPVAAAPPPDPDPSTPPADEVASVEPQAADAAPVEPETPVEPEPGEDAPRDAAPSEDAVEASPATPDASPEAIEAAHPVEDDAADAPADAADTEPVATDGDASPAEDIQADGPFSPIPVAAPPAREAADSGSDADDADDVAPIAPDADPDAVFDPDPADADESDEALACFLPNQEPDDDEMVEVDAAGETDRTPSPYPTEGAPAWAAAEPHDDASADERGTGEDAAVGSEDAKDDEPVKASAYDDDDLDPEDDDYDPFEPRRSADDDGLGLAAFEDRAPVAAMPMPMLQRAFGDPDSRGGQMDRMARVSAVVAVADDVDVGLPFCVTALLHAPEQAVEAKNLAEAAAGSGMGVEVPPRRDGVNVEARLEIDGMTIAPSVQAMDWTGQPVGVTFKLAPPASWAGRLMEGRVTFVCAGMPFAMGRLRIGVSRGDSRAARPLARLAPRLRTAYPIYAPADRERVVEDAELATMWGTEFHGPALAYDVGGRWSEGVMAALPSCEVGLVYWSEAAARDPRLLGEIERASRVCALTRGRPPPLFAVRLDDPRHPAPTPPAFVNAGLNDPMRTLR